MLDRALTYEAPTYANQLAAARRILKEKGREALRNPHALIGKVCKCGGCFCCAARQVVAEHDAETSRELQGLAFSKGAGE